MASAFHEISFHQLSFSALISAPKVDQAAQLLQSSFRATDGEDLANLAVRVDADVSDLISDENRLTS